MSEPTNKEQLRVAQHIAEMADESVSHGLRGDMPSAVGTLAPLFYEYGPDEAYAWVRAVLRKVVVPPCDCGMPHWPVIAQWDADQQKAVPRDVHDPEVPLSVRLLAQMIAAQSNGDEDTEYALWNAAVTAEDAETVTAVMNRALLYAVRGAQARQDQQ